MSAPSGDRLRELRAEAAAQLAARLAAGNVPLAELRELQERLSLLDAVLDDQRALDKRRRVTALWPVMLVAAVLLVSATVPVPSVPLSLEVKASAISLSLVDESVLEPQSIDGELRIEGFTSLESADGSLGGAAAGELVDRIAIRAEETRLRGVNLPAGASLTIQGRDRMAALHVESPRSPVIADVEVRGKTVVRLGDSARSLDRAFAQGEWLRLIAGDASHPDQAAPPLTLSLSHRGESAFHFLGLRPSTLRFAERRQAAGAVAVVGSSLEGGSLTLPATNQTVQLAAGDWLEIDGLAVQRCELVAGSPLLLKLNGSARTLRIRVGDFERSLKPSLLEYVSRHHMVALLWGAAALLWGALAWIREQFARART